MAVGAASETSIGQRVRPWDFPQPASRACARASAVFDFSFTLLAMVSPPGSGALAQCRRNSLRSLFLRRRSAATPLPRDPDRLIPLLGRAQISILSSTMIRFAPQWLSCQPKNRDFRSDGSACSRSSRRIESSDIARLSARRSCMNGRVENTNLRGEPAERRAQQARARAWLNSELSVFHKNGAVGAVMRMSPSSVARTASSYVNAAARRHRFRPARLQYLVIARLMCWKMCGRALWMCCPDRKSIRAALAYFSGSPPHDGGNRWFPSVTPFVGSLPGRADLTAFDRVPTPSLLESPEPHAPPGHRGCDRVDAVLGVECGEIFGSMPP